MIHCYNLSSKNPKRIWQEWKIKLKKRKNRQQKVGKRRERHQLTIVQDEVSRPALRQTVMTTNCHDKNNIKSRSSPKNFINFMQKRQWHAQGNECCQLHKFNNTSWRHLNNLTWQKLSRRSVHSLCKPCCLRGDSLESFRCQKPYLWRGINIRGF